MTPATSLSRPGFLDFPKKDGQEIHTVRTTNPLAVSKALAVAVASNKVYASLRPKDRKKADVRTKELYPSVAKTMLKTYRRLLNLETRHPNKFIALHAEGRSIRDIKTAFKGTR